MEETCRPTFQVPDKTLRPPNVTISSMASSLAVNIRRLEPVLVAPAEPTPHEFKLLSDIDDQHGNRFHTFILQFYRHNPSMAGRDPAQVIKQSLAKALVHYYPLAGRLREALGGKLAVECTGEGVMLVEADADVEMEQFGEPPVAPPSWAAELIHNVEGSGGVLGCPLLLFQITRLLCGGFIMGIRLNHAIVDGAGLVQFMMAVCEMSHGKFIPSVQPVWARDLLNARCPPQVTHIHREYNEVKVIDTKCALPPLDHLQRQYIFFGPSEMSALKNRLPPNLRRSSRFEIITASNWWCRTIALDLHPEQEVRATFTMSIRGTSKSFLPTGYYGNSFVMPTAVSTAGELCASPLAHALELVKEAKSKVNAEYVQSVADLMVLKGRLHHSMVHTYFASDATSVKFEGVDFGWGKPVYDCQVLANRSSFYIKAKSHNGEHGVLVSVCLPAPTMDRFMIELKKLTRGPISSSL